MPRRLATLALLAAIVIIIGWLVWANPAHAATPRPGIRLAPPWVCTMENRMEAFIDEDDIMWECVCEALRTGHICHWAVVGGVDPVAARKRARRAHKRLIPPLYVRITL